MPKVTKKSSSRTTRNNRPILYPEIEARKCTKNNALTAALAKKLLGWSETPLPERPDESAAFKDEYGKPIWCHNNVNPDYTNRPITWSNVLALKQEILRKMWRFNGETIIIGVTGLILNGQHQLIALVLAVQEWEQYREDWDNWDTEPTIEKIVVFGIEETDDVVNTMDTCKPRTLLEVLYRSEIFATMKVGERKDCSRLLDHAVRLLWHRLGVKQDAFAPRRTHSEALDFIHRHPTLLKCVKHVHEENSDGDLGTVLSPGYFSALVFMMACSATDPIKYHEADVARESVCDLTNHGKAEDFVVQISGNSASMMAIRQAITELTRDGIDSREARMAVVAKAWIAFSSGEKVTVEGIWPIFVQEDDIKRLGECPTVGGIDLGNPKDDIAKDEEDPTEEEVNQFKAEEAKIKKEKQGKGKRASFEVGDIVWVNEDGGAWEGEIVDIYDANGKPVGRVKSQATGKAFDAPLTSMSYHQPT